MKTLEKIVVIGAGPAGIGVGLSLSNDCLVLDRAPNAGGLSCSEIVDGAMFDYGGHSFHTPHPEVHNLVFDAVEMYVQRRNAQCFLRGEFIPYPFQKYFRNLSDGTIVEECAAGLSETE